MGTSDLHPLINESTDKFLWGLIGQNASHGTKSEDGNQTIHPSNLVSIFQARQNKQSHLFRSNVNKITVVEKNRKNLLTCIMDISTVKVCGDCCTLLPFYHHVIWWSALKKSIMRAHWTKHTRWCKTGWWVLCNIPCQIWYLPPNVLEVTLSGLVNVLIFSWHITLFSHCIYLGGSLVNQSHDSVGESKSAGDI